MFKNKSLLVLIVVLSLSFTFSSIAFGQAPPKPASDNVLEGLNTSAETADITTGSGSLSGFVGGAINYSFAGIAAVFVTVIMIGGYLWMTARGNEEKVGKAKTFILNGLFGLIVIFIGYGLVYVILFSLGAAIGA